MITLTKGEKVLARERFYSEGCISIYTIKSVRERTGCGLLEAKAAVEQYLLTLRAKNPKQQLELDLIAMFCMEKEIKAILYRVYGGKQGSIFFANKVEDLRLEIARALELQYREQCVTEQEKGGLALQA